MCEHIARAQHIEKWTHWDLNPGPSACEADVIPLHHVPHVGYSYQHEILQGFQEEARQGAAFLLRTPLSDQRDLFSKAAK